jgi:hypothetical protein
VFVGEHAARRPGPRGNEARAGRHLGTAVQFGITAPVEPNGGPHHPVHQVEADQLALLHAAADHELVPLRGVADIFDCVLVLIGPEAMDVVVPGRRAEHGPCRRGALLLCVVVMLDPDPSEKRVEVVRHVAGRVDVSRAGPAEPVDQDPVVLRDR